MEDGLALLHRLRPPVVDFVGFQDEQKVAEALGLERVHLRVDVEAEPPAPVLERHVAPALERQVEIPLEDAEQLVGDHLVPAKIGMDIVTNELLARDSQRSGGVEDLLEIEERRAARGRHLADRALDPRERAHGATVELERAAVLGARRVRVARHLEGACNLEVELGGGVVDLGRAVQELERGGAVLPLGHRILGEADERTPPFHFDGIRSERLGEDRVGRRIRMDVARERAEHDRHPRILGIGGGAVGRLAESLLQEIELGAPAGAAVAAVARMDDHPQRRARGNPLVEDPLQAQLAHRRGERRARGMLHLAPQVLHVLGDHLVVPHHPNQQIGRVLEALLEESADLGRVPAGIPRVHHLDHAPRHHRGEAQTQPIGEAADLVGEPLDARLAEREDAEPILGFLREE